MKVLRRMFAAAAALLAALTLVSAQVSRVAYSQAFETDSFVSLAEEVARTPEMRAKISESLTEQVLKEAAIGSSLDARALKLVGMTAAEVDERIAGIVRGAVDTVLASEAFAGLWSAAARTAHESLMTAVEADRDSVAPPVVVALTPLLKELSAALATTDDRLSKVVKFGDIVPVGETFEFEFIPTDTVDDIRTAAVATRNLRTASMIGSVVLLAAAVLLPVRRRNGVRLASAAVAFASVVVLAARSAGSGAVEDQAGENAGIARAVYDAVTGPLSAPAVFLLVVAAAATVATFVRRGQASGSL